MNKIILFIQVSEGEAQKTAHFIGCLDEFDEAVIGSELKAMLSSFLKDTSDKPNIQRLGRVSGDDLQDCVFCQKESYPDLECRILSVKFLM